MKNSAVELVINLNLIENCGAEEWKYNWYLYRQLEIAHWHYEDWYCKKHHVSTTTKAPFFTCYPMKSGDNAFYEAFLKQFPSIARKIGDLEEARKARNKAMREIERVGGIICDRSTGAFLLVKDASTRSLMFPRGKINKSESKRECLVRELKEELGVNLNECKVTDCCLAVPQIGGEHISYYCLITNLRQMNLFPHPREIESYEWMTLPEIRATDDCVFYGVKEMLPFLIHFEHKFKKWKDRTASKHFSDYNRDDLIPHYQIVVCVLMDLRIEDEFGR